MMKELKEVKGQLTQIQDKGVKCPHAHTIGRLIIAEFKDSESNAPATADSVIVPVQAHYLPLKGMTQLMKNIGKVQRQINPGLKVDGVLLTLADMRKYEQYKSRKHNKNMVRTENKSIKKENI